LWNEWRLQPLREISAPRKSFSAACKAEIDFAELTVWLE
jgi:hypothetical protein